MKLNVKKGDNVVVLAGKDAKKTGEILEIDRENARVKVAGVNIQAHHKKPRNKDDKGGILKTEGAISVSNVMVICPACKKATRVAHNVIDGKKVRVCKKCGASLDVKQIKSAKPAKKVEKKVEPKAETKEVKPVAKATKPATAEKVAKPATKTSEKTTKTATKTTKPAEKAAKPAETKKVAAKTTKTAEKPATKSTAKSSKKA